MRFLCKLLIIFLLPSAVFAAQKSKIEEEKSFLSADYVEYDAEEDFTAIDQFRCRPGPALPFQGWTDPLIAKRCYLRVRTRATLLIPNRALSAVLRGYAARETKVTIAYENGRIRRINLHRSFVLELERPSGIVTICSEPILGEAERSFPLTIEAVQTRFANCVYETDITALTGQLK